MDTLSDRFMYYCGLLAPHGVSVDDLKHIQNLIDKEEQGLLIELPCKVGDTVYVLEKCKNIATVLDGTLYGTATGYYCPYELNGKCPHDCDDCEEVEELTAVFEDTIKYIGIDETGICLFTENTRMCCTIGKDTFLTRSEAEEALAKMGGK